MREKEISCHCPDLMACDPERKNPVQQLALHTHEKILENFGSGGAAQW